MSGGRSLPTCAGDISSVHRDGQPLVDKFVIECKHVNADLFGPLTFGKKTPVCAWWLKLLVECDRHGRSPLLTVKQQGKPIVACVTSSYLVGIQPQASFFWTSSAPWGRMRIDVVSFDRLLTSASFKKMVLE